MYTPPVNEPPTCHTDPRSSSGIVLSHNAHESEVRRVRRVEAAAVVLGTMEGRQVRMGWYMGMHAVVHNLRVGQQSAANMAVLSQRVA